MTAHETLIVILVAVLGALALVIVALCLYAFAYVMVTAAREIRKAWRGES